MSVEAIEDLDEERSSHEASLAEALSMLSVCEHVPDEVRAVMPFESAGGVVRRERLARLGSQGPGLAAVA